MACRNYEGMYIIRSASGSSSVAERQLPKLNVAGSIPVSRSNKINSIRKQLRN